MAKLPCARFVKFIRPSVTDSPTASRNSNIPKAKPSNSTPANAAIMRNRPASLGSSSASGLLLHRGFDGILDVLDLVELDVLEDPVLLLDAADIDRVDDV